MSNNSRSCLVIALSIHGMSRDKRKPKMKTRNGLNFFRKNPVKIGCVLAEIMTYEEARVYL